LIARQLVDIGDEQLLARLLQLIVDHVARERHLEQRPACGIDAFDLEAARCAGHARAARAREIHIGEEDRRHDRFGRIVVAIVQHGGEG
jgi:hypothetical protein